MKPNFRICPQCATRNRLDKEFCVKCGEPLEGVPAGDPNDPTAQEKAEFVLSEQETRSPVVPIIAGVVALSALGVGFWYLQSTSVPPPTDTGGRSMAAQAQSAPDSTPIPPGPGVADYSAGMAAMNAGDFRRAAELLRKAADAAPSQPDFRLALADALEKSGSMPDALIEFERAAQIDPTNPRYISQWAKALNRAGRFPDAIRAYEQALLLNPENVSNLREIASLEMKGNDLAGARPYLERIVRLQPDDLVPRQDLARALEATGDLKGAAEQYRQILTVMPNAEVSRALLSEVLMKDNQATEALALVNEGLAANPSSAAMYREKGRIYDRLGDNGNAVAAYREYLRLAPTASDARVFGDRIKQLAPSAEQ